jgi:hypothetical protein
VAVVVRYDRPFAPQTNRKPRRAGAHGRSQLQRGRRSERKQAGLGRMRKLQSSGEGNRKCSRAHRLHANAVPAKRHRALDR